MCTQCQRGKKRRRTNASVAGFSAMKKKQIQGKIITGAKVAAGYVLGGVVATKISTPADGEVQTENQQYMGMIAPVVAGIFIAKKQPAFASGLIAQGAVRAFKHFAPEQATQLGLGGIPYRSYQLPGVAGSREPQIVID